MTQTLLEHKKWTVIDKLSDSDYTQPTQGHLLPKSSGDQNAPQPKASGYHNLPKHPRATFQVTKGFMHAFISMKPPWAVISYEKYLMVEEPRRLAIDGQHCHCPWTCTPEGTLYVSRIPGSLPFNMRPHPGEAIRCDICFTLLYHTFDTDYAAINTSVKRTISAIQEWMAVGTSETVIWHYMLDSGSERELWIQVKELLFDDSNLSNAPEDKKLWFTQMEVLDFIYHQLFLTTYNLRCQPTASQFFQPLAL